MKARNRAGFPAFGMGLVAVLLPTALFAAPVSTTMLIAVAPSSIAPGDSATVTATVTPNTGTINCGKGQIQYNIFDASNVSLTGWLQLANDLTVTANQFSAVFDTNVIPVVAGEKVSFRAGYASSGGGCDFAGWGPGQSPTTDLMIVGASGSCPNNQITGVYISIEGPNGNGAPAPGSSGPWSFDVKVKACQNLDFVSAQGGANGWAPVKSFAAPVGTSVDQSVKNKNTVYLWTIGAMTQYQTQTLSITVDGTIKNSPAECGKVKLLNGDWSALYSTDGGLTKTKSAYSTYTATITVTCP
jgi:hypothetical protein